MIALQVALPSLLCVGISRSEACVAHGNRVSQRDTSFVEAPAVWLRGYIAMCWCVLPHGAAYMAALFGRRPVAAEASMLPAAALKRPKD